ncbi:hypothetical protein [Aromatoleum diolicum]|uniref:Uncharacterized protein n=1 Tax=Aromatoleum diolicum TaxID=75796 RepID=A0ABX1Q9F4_9RHOO|nr:hypothetical protein [Aromatoleum diolicum]NMG74012.1 hypothetical protein [Aromatoleum diolicum]
MRLRQSNLNNSFGIVSAGAGKHHWPFFDSPLMQQDLAHPAGRVPPQVISHNAKMQNEYANGFMN